MVGTCGILSRWHWALLSSPCPTFSKKSVPMQEAPSLGNLKFTVWDLEGAPWFIAKEVADALGIKKPAMSAAVSKLSEGERIKANLNKFGTTEPIAGNPMRQFLSESGLYKLIMRSNKPEASQFQDWVTKVVLPAIRKDGAYVEGEEKLASGEMSEDEFVFKAMEIMQGGLFHVCH